MRSRSPEWALTIPDPALTITGIRTKTLEVSGHLAWLPLLTAQAWMLAFPVWLVGLGITATLSTAHLKFVVFQGPSGGPGLLVGLALMTALLVMGARERRPAVAQ